MLNTFDTYGYNSYGIPSNGVEVTEICQSDEARS